MRAFFIFGNWRIDFGGLSYHAEIRKIKQQVMYKGLQVKPSPKFGEALLGGPYTPPANRFILRSFSLDDVLPKPSSSQAVAYESREVGPLSHQWRRRVGFANL